MIELSNQLYMGHKEQQRRMAASLQLPPRGIPEEEEEGRFD